MQYAILVTPRNREIEPFIKSMVFAENDAQIEYFADRAFKSGDFQRVRLIPVNLDPQPEYEDEDED